MDHSALKQGIQAARDGQAQQARAFQIVCADSSILL